MLCTPHLLSVFQKVRVSSTNCIEQWGDKRILAGSHTRLRNVLALAIIGSHSCTQLHCTAICQSGAHLIHAKQPLNYTVRAVCTELRFTQLFANVVTACYDAGVTYVVLKILEHDTSLCVRLPQTPWHQQRSNSTLSHTIVACLAACSVTAVAWRPAAVFLKSWRFLSSFFELANLLVTHTEYRICHARRWDNNVFTRGLQKVACQGGPAFDVFNHCLQQIVALAPHNCYSPEGTFAIYREGESKTRASFLGSVWTFWSLPAGHSTVGCNALPNTWAF